MKAWHAALATVFVMAAPSAHAVDAQTGAGFQIIARHSGKCLDVVSASLADTAPIQQFTCLGPQQLNQVWLLVPVGTGFNIVAAHSLKCLDVRSVSLADGAQVQQFACLGPAQTNQVWHLVPVQDGSGYFEIRPLHSLKCLDVSSASFANTAPVQQFTCFGTFQWNQHWTVRPVAVVG